MIKAESFTTPYPYDLYLPEGPGPFPLVCQTPILGRLAFLEDLYFEKKVAAYFASKGMACAVLHRPFFDFDSGKGLEQIDRYLHGSVERNEKILELLKKHPAVDADKIGTFGMSMGSIVSCLWAQKNPDLKHHVWALGGADLPEIFVTSEDPLMRSYQQAALKKSGLSPAGLREELRKVFTLDTKSGTAHVPKENILLILAVFDRIVRFSTGLKLRKALNNPPTVYLPLGHYTAMLALPVMKRCAANFLKKRFSAHA